MREGWVTSGLGDLCEILDSQRKPITKRNRVAGDIPYYGATGIKDHVADYLFDEQLVLVGEDGAKWGAGENTAFAVEGKCWVNNHAHVLRPKREKILDNWIIYFLISSDLSEFVSGLTVPKLNQGNLRRIPIPVPPLPEQRRIVAILDEAFEGIAAAKANAEKNLENAREVFESYVQEKINNLFVDFKSQSLSAIGDLKSGGTPSRKEKAYWGGKIPWYSSGELNNVFTTEPKELISESGLNNSNAKLFAKGSLLIGMYDTAALKMSLLDRSAAFNQAIAGVPPCKNVDLEYVRFAITAIRQSVLNLRRGVRQKNLSLQKIKDIKIPLPPLDKQVLVRKETTKILEDSLALQSKNINRLNLLDELKKSLLHQAFNGDL